MHTTDPQDALAQAVATQQQLRRDLTACEQLWKTQRDRIQPIRAKLLCPHCGFRHLDEGEWLTRRHHVHRCASCGQEWDSGLYSFGVAETDEERLAVLQATIDGLEATLRGQPLLTQLSPPAPWTPLALEIQHPLVTTMATALADLLTHAGAPNYVETRMTHRTAGELLMTVQRVNGQTPHALRQAADARAATLSQALADTHADLCRALAALATLRIYAGALHADHADPWTRTITETIQSLAKKGLRSESPTPRPLSQDLLLLTRVEWALKRAIDCGLGDELIGPTETLRSIWQQLADWHQSMATGTPSSANGSPPEGLRD